MRPKQRSWSCICGATVAVPGDCPDVIWRDLKGMFQIGHEGDGHGECDRKTATRARASAERKQNREAEKARRSV